VCVVVCRRAAIYVYNDKAFTENDLKNLSAIGQASKMERLATTGRFGLGFNAVYHFTGVVHALTHTSITMCGG
jgi:hypothetical protein